MNGIASNARGRNSFPTWLSEEMRPDILLKSLSAGVLTYVLQIILVSSFAALVFSGNFAYMLPSGLGFIIAGDAALCAVVALFSSYRGSIAIAQDAPSAILAVGVAAAAAALPVGTRPETQFSTVLMMVIGTTLVSASLFLVLGSLKLGGLVRFLPYPVIGGFLAGTGWLLATGAFGVMTGTALSAEFFSPALLWRWLPGITFGALLFLATSRLKSPLVLPGGVALALALFYLAVWVSGTSVAALGREGWLLGPFPSASMWHFPINTELLFQVNWTILVASLPQVASAAAISVVAMLLNVSGIELVIRKDMDPNRELVAAGLGNLAAALAGGIVGYPAISLSTLNHNMTRGKKLPALLIALLMVVTIAVGATALNYVPKLILGSLLFFVGLSLLFDWVYRSWFRFPKTDFLVVVLILGVIALRGFVDGIAVGLVLTILIFVVNYSRIRVVKHALTGKTYRSRVTRDPREQGILDQHGDEVYILKLQGFVFFGTANSLVEQIRTRLKQADLPSPRAILLDFSQVTGLDSTGLLCFERLLQLIAGQQIALVVTGATTSIRRQIEAAGLQVPGQVQFFLDLDHGMEWSENAILASARRASSPPESSSEREEGFWPKGIPVERLTRYMTRRELSPGEYLIHQGDEPDLLFLIEGGAVTAQLEEAGREPVRLQMMRGGRSVGEIGFYLGIQRTATVVADEPSVVYGLSRQDLEQLGNVDPEAASALHHLMAFLLSERVAHLTRVVGALEG